MTRVAYRFNQKGHGFDVTVPQTWLKIRFFQTLNGFSEKLVSDGAFRFEFSKLKLT